MTYYKKKKESDHAFMDIVLPLLLQVVLIALNALFACAEIAVISTNEAKVNKLIADGDRRAKSLQKLMDNPSKFLSTIQITITLSGFLGSAFAADNFAGMLVEWLQTLGIVSNENIGAINTLSVILITVILSFFTLVFGELVPKRVGMRKAEKIALIFAPALNFISKVFTPIVWLLTISINGILHLIGIDPHESDGDEGEENIRLMVDMSSEKGLIDKEEQEMIQNVFEFDDLCVSDFATHRTDVEFLWEEDDVETWDITIRTSFHKNYPICRENADDIIGVLNIREYFKLDNKSKDNVMEKCVHSAYFVPESLKADQLFKQMKATNNKFAVVLDERGGVDGIVTMDDILEQIVGDFNGNGEEETEDDILQIDEKTWEMHGLLSIDELNALIGSTFSSEEYETIGGLVFGHYGFVPADETVFEIDIENYHFSILKISEHQIEKMRIQKNN